MASIRELHREAAAHGYPKTDCFIRPLSSTTSPTALSSIAWTRHHTLARGLKATNRLLLPAPATKQEPPTEGTAPELVSEG